MKVYIASMNMRGEWAKAPEGAKKVNVTSAQSKSSAFRLDFSPMTESGYKGYWCFENWWQSLKRFEGINEEKWLSWWLNQTKPKRRYPGSRGKKCLYAKYKNRTFNYVDSRKELYVPKYYKLIKNAESLNVKSDIIVVYDFDGPRKEDGSVDIQPVSIDLLKEKINDTRFPFGHGYIIAGLLAGIKPKEYI